MILFDIHHENAFFLRNALPFCFPFVLSDNLYCRFSRLLFLFPMTPLFRSSVSIFFIFGARFFAFSGLKIVAYKQLSRPFVFSLFPVILPVFWR